MRVTVENCVAGGMIPFKFPPPQKNSLHCQKLSVWTTIFGQTESLMKLCDNVADRLSADIAITVPGRADMW